MGAHTPPLNPFGDHISDPISLNMTFGRELVVLDTTPTCLVISGACLEVVWRFQQRTFYIGSLSCQEVLN